jgi:hypothetical protein
MPVRCENKEIVAPHLILILEDDSSLSSLWLDPFQEKEFEVINIQDTRKLEGLNNLSNADLDRVRFVLADQSFTYSHCKPFIRKLKLQNPDVVIVEKSALLTEQCFPETDICLDGYYELISLRFILEATSDPKLKLAKIKYYASREAVEKQKADSYSEWYSHLGNPQGSFDHYLKGQARTSWKRLIQHPDLFYVLESLSVGEDDFISQCEHLDGSTRSLIMHLCWDMLSITSIMRHLVSGKPEISESVQRSTSFTRLQSLLESLN